MRVGRVVIHSTQPWPYPANLVMGAIGEAFPDGEEIVLKHDPELEDAQWVGLGKVKSALEGVLGRRMWRPRGLLRLVLLGGGRGRCKG